MRRLVAAIASALLAVALLAGCGSEQLDAGSSSGAQTTKVIDMTFTGDTVNRTVS